MALNTQLTSVKVRKDLFKEFKVECVRNKFSITKLNERCMYLYLTDEAWRTNLHNTLHTELTGSL